MVDFTYIEFFIQLIIQRSFADYFYIYKKLDKMTIYFSFNIFQL